METRNETGVTKYGGQWRLQKGPFIHRYELETQPGRCSYKQVFFQRRRKILTTPRRSMQQHPTLILFNMRPDFDITMAAPIYKTSQVCCLVVFVKIRDRKAPKLFREGQQRSPDPWGFMSPNKTSEQYRNLDSTLILTILHLPNQECNSRRARTFFKRGGEELRSKVRKKVSRDKEPQVFQGMVCQSKFKAELQ